MDNQTPQGRSASRRRRKRRKERRRKRMKWMLCLLAVAAGFVLVGRWAADPDWLQEGKDRLQHFLWNDVMPDAGHAKSLLVVEQGSGTVCLSKEEKKRCQPASLAKLFVIEYAATFTQLEDVVEVNEAALALTKPESSMAWLEPKEYYLRDLFAAMLVPSGNDAAYAVADYCGGRIDPTAAPGQERVEVFMENLRQHLSQQGYGDTMLYDPSGFDEEAYTTAKDLCRVAERLLAYDWVREMVGQLWYTAELPDGSIQSWKNTNLFLEPVSEFYHENVIGVKTGSMPDNYHLLVLYRQHGKEFLVCSLGSKSDTARYHDVIGILKKLDASDYLQEE